MSAAVSFPPGYLKENNGPRAIAACTVILVITTILFPMRFYSRSLTPGQRAWDDHLLIPAYMFLLGLIACVYAEVVQAGLGRHAAAVMIEDPSGGMISKYLQLLYILDWFYVPSNMLSRVSVVCMYLRIFTDKWARAACWAVMAFLVANCVATIIAAQLECTPLAYTWNKNIVGGTCFDQILWYEVSNFPNIAGDVMIAVLPIKTVWALKASTARKAGIAAVCLTGSIGMIASCVRASVFYLQRDVIRNDPTFCDEAFSWTVIECGMYFSAACLIGMRPIFAKLPPFLKARFTTANKSALGQRKMDKLRFSSHGKSSHYASMQDGQEDAERGLRQLSVDDAAQEREGGFPLLDYSGHVRNPFAESGSDRGQIRVETSIEVRHDTGNWAHSRNNEENAQVDVYSVPAYTK